jgi:hypothetical protein
MTNSKYHIRDEFFFSGVLIIFTILGIFLLHYYQYQINPDGVSYISIAKKYFNGDYRDAINGFWGPMISWLLVPFLGTNISPLVAVKIQMMIIGLLTLIGLKLLLTRFTIDESLKRVMLFSSIPILLYFVFFVISPDLHVVCALIFYFASMFDSDYPEKKMAGVLGGLFGGIAYLSKSYVFPFFIVHYPIINFMHYMRNSNEKIRKKIIFNFITGMTVFAVISGCWIMMISSKYDRFTFGTSGAVNYKLTISPLKLNIDALQSPPNKSALSIFEDTSYLAFSVRPWNIIGSRENLKYYIGHVIKNLIASRNILLSFSVLSFTILFVHIFILGYPTENRWEHYNSSFLIVTLLIYILGYILIIVEERYVWIVLILLFTMGGYQISFLLRNNLLFGKWKTIVISVYILSFVLHPSIQLLRNLDTGKEEYRLGNLLNQYGIAGAIASNTDPGLTLEMTYYVNGKYFGALEKDIDMAEFERTVKHHSIDYYFEWLTNDEVGARLPFPYNEFRVKGLPLLRIYNLKSAYRT